MASLVTDNLSAGSVNASSLKTHVLSSPLNGLTVGAITGTPVTLVANTLNTTDHTGTAARVVVLPAASDGVKVGYCWPADTGAGTLTCTFDCAGTDAFTTGTVIESRAGGVASFDTSAAGETQLVYTGAGAATNFISFGSIILFSCLNDGLWDITLMAKSNPASTGVTGVMAFAA